MKLGKKQIGILIALTIGIVMVFLPGNQEAMEKETKKTRSEVLMGSANTFTPFELSDIILSGKRDYQLIDIRDKKKFKEETIRTAINIPHEKIMKKEVYESQVSDFQRVIIFSDQPDQLAQAWVVLSSAGKKVYILEGGYTAWESQIMEPELPENPTADQMDHYRKARSISAYYKGEGAPEIAPIAGPARSAVPMGIRKKKKLKGCGLK
jgi:rhodanese-related sulfurtransferase